MAPSGLTASLSQRKFLGQILGPEAAPPSNAHLTGKLPGNRGLVQERLKFGVLARKGRELAQRYNSITR